jgi:hypothetical protein
MIGGLTESMCRVDESWFSYNGDASSFLLLRSERASELVPAYK